MVELWGVMGPDGDLLYVSEADSRVDGESFDGPALWSSREEAERVNAECGGLAEGWQIVKVTLHYGEL